MERSQRRSFTDDYKRQAVDLVASSGRSIGSVAKELGLRDSVLRRYRGHREHKKSRSSLRLFPTSLLPAITVAARVDTDSHAGNLDTHTGTWTVVVISPTLYVPFARCVIVTVVIALNDHTARTAPITAAIIIADHSNRRSDLRWKVLTLLNEYVSSERVVSREHARARY